MLHVDILMVEPEPIMEEDIIPKGMPVLENASLYVELEANPNAEIQ